MYAALRRTIYDALFSHSDMAHRVSLWLGLLIALNVVAIMVDTVPNLTVQDRAILDWFNRFSLLVFTVEYLLRLWSVPVALKYAKPLTGRLRYALTPLALVDLIVILPVLIHFIFPWDLRALRILRLLRVLKIFRIEQYSSSLARLSTVINDKKSDLAVIGIILVMAVIITSTLMFYAENGAQPKVFSSIPASMWWSIITLTTIGYGDAVPVTALGKIIAGLTAILGVSLFTMPAGIIASGFLETKTAKGPVGPTVCPHCGKALVVADPHPAHAPIAPL
jgi:voltage-gated potassium channel